MLTITAIVSLILGWLLGLLSPLIVEHIRSKKHISALAQAIKDEAAELEFRFALTAFLILQHKGEFDAEFLKWMSLVLDRYEGNEPVEVPKRAVKSLQDANETQRTQIIQAMAAQPGVGIGLKTFSLSLMNSLIGQTHDFPLPFQRRIHELRNQVHNLNEEVLEARHSHRKTFDESISESNHKRLVEDLHAKHKFIFTMMVRAAKMARALVEEEV